jgi:hypothetical protein
VLSLNELDGTAKIVACETVKMGDEAV